MENDEDAISPETLNDWEQVQSPFTQTPTHLPQPTHSNSGVIATSGGDSGDSSSIFPDNTQYEALQEDEEEDPRHPPPQTPISPAPRRRGESGVLDLRLRLRLLGCRLYLVASEARRYAAAVACRRRFWVCGSAVAGVVAALLMSLFYIRRVQLWRQNKERRLMLLIRDRDQRIRQLQLQVAEMNALLSARRRVRVIRMG